MTTQLALTLGTESGSSGSYWLRLEQENQEPDAVTKEQAADLADSIFSVTPCTDPDSYHGGKDLEPVPNVHDTMGKAKEILATASEILKLPVCGSSAIGFGMDLDSGGYTAKVRVYRSHVCEEIKPPGTIQYPLTANNGTVSAAGRVVEIVEIIKAVDGYQVTLDLPIAYDCTGGDYTHSYVFETDAAVLGTSGSTVYFDEFVETLRLRYTTEYDLYSIAVNGAGSGVAGECTVFCEYKGLTASIDLEPPVVDEETDTLKCLTINYVITEPGAGDGGDSGALPPWDGTSPKCYQTTIVEQRCACTGKKHDSYKIETEVNCPDGETDGGHGVGDTLRTIAYVDCGITDKYSTPEFYEKSCCHPGDPNVRCKKVYGPWSGGAGDSDKLDKYRGQPNVSIIPVSPNDGLCGIQTIEQKVTGNCCEDAEQLKVTGISDSIKPFGVADVYIEGDISPIKWTVNGGYVFRGGKQKTETGTPGHVVIIHKSGCDDAKVGFSGECDSHNATITLDLSDVSPLTIYPDSVTAAPGAYVVPAAGGGMPPYEYSSGKLIEVSRGVFKCPDDFCGMATITAKDSCNDSADMDVKSTAGHWESYPQGSFSKCSPPGAYPEVNNGGNIVTVESTNGKYKVTVIHTMAGWYNDCGDYSGDCSPGNVIVPSSFSRTDCTSRDAPSNPDCEGGKYNSGCCKVDVSGDAQKCGTTYNYLVYADEAWALSEWVCP